MEQSPRLSLSYLAPSQAQKHVTVNETFRLLDQLVQTGVASRTISAQPGSPQEGDAYILPASPTGTDWAAFAEHSIAAYQDGAWVEIAPAEGWRSWVADANAFVVFDGSAWDDMSASASLTQFGINTSADATNRLAVKSDAVLFSHDDVTPGNDDCIVKVSKAAAGDTASHIFQTGFSGRAELGLLGDDDFHIKVSPDNFTTSYDALTIDKDNGFVGVGTAQADASLTVVGDFAFLAGDDQNDNSVKILRMGCFHYDIDQEPGALVNARMASGSNRVEFGGGSSLMNAATEINFITAATSTTTTGSVRMNVASDGGVVVGSPTGGSKGAGAINAQAVYDDNALLTCYVFDQALDGAIDPAKWDARVPDRTTPAVVDDVTGAVLEPEARIARAHAPMRRFAARAGTEHDPLTLDGYARHWREKRHLTSMPNEAAFDPERGMAAGEWIQRLVETVEIQAVLIEQLNERIKALEADGGEQDAKP